MSRPPAFVILRAAPGSGKSTWVENNGLEDIAVSADEWRIRLFGIARDEDGREFIPQTNQGLVWSKVRADIEDRMAAGEDVLLDACSLATRDMGTYVELCEAYGYKGFVVEFYHDVDLDTALMRNAQREEYKQVPEYVIERFYDKVWNNPVPEFYEVLTADEAYDAIFSDEDASAGSEAAEW